MDNKERLFCLTKSQTKFTRIHTFDYIFSTEEYIRTLWEEHRLRVFENRVLKRIFGPKSDEVIGGWRKLHTEELHNLYCES
jgi:hypothetical protein